MLSALAAEYVRPAGRDLGQSPPDPVLEELDELEEDDDELVALALESVR